jgi:hypothetical protein
MMLLHLDVDPQQESYQLLSQIPFAFPIYACHSIDLNHDGVNELLVTSMFGIHTLQVSCSFIQS